MSAGRIFPILVLSFWVASMGWLVKTKVIPLMVVRSAPIRHTLPDKESGDVLEESWVIQWQDRTIGNVQTRAFRDASHGQIDSLVSLDDAPADDMLREFFGPANHLIKLAVRDFRTNSLSLRITSTMMLDYAGQLESFSSRVHLGGVGNLFQIQGNATGHALSIDVNAVGEFWPSTFPKKLLTREFELPSESFVADAFAPPSQLKDLRVGSTWQHHTYRALSPNQPLQRVQASVNSIENIGWQGNSVPTFVVSLRNVDNDLSVSDEEIGKMWVRADGIVLRQTLRFGNLEIRFVRDESLAEDQRLKNRESGIQGAGIQGTGIHGTGIQIGEPATSD